MSRYFRDTVFGQVVRLLSSDRLLKFPDELDLSLWKQCVTEKISTAVPGGVGESSNETPSKLGDGGETGQTQGFEATSSQGSEDKQGIHGRKSSLYENERIHLVDWYGLDDPEVRPHPASNPSLSPLRMRQC